MNPVDYLYHQQIGRVKWEEYNNRFTRLRCTRNDDYQSILPSITEDSNGYDTPIFACKFAQNKGYEHILALANEEGHLAIHDTSDKEPRIGNKIHNNAIFDLAWLCNQMKLITVSGDHTARLVDINRDHLCTTQIFTGHTRSVKTVVARSDDLSTFATGGRDGCILVWDTRSHVGHNLITGPDKTIMYSHQIRSHSTLTPSKRKMYTPLTGANSVTGLAFQDENTLISCSAGDGKIKFWDLRKAYKISKRAPIPKYVIDYSGNTTRNGFSNLLLDNDGIRLYANCLDNTIYCYNIANHNPKPVMCYTGHQNSTFFVKSSLSYDGKYILCGSSDQKAYIWNTDYPNPIVSLNGHTAEVTCVAWRPTPEMVLVTCSDDMRHKIWKIGAEILPDNWEYEGRGEAEALNILPKNFKRTYVYNSSPSFKKLKKCNICLYTFDKICENCNYRGDSTIKKRILLTEVNQPLVKRLQKSSQRCLFQAINTNKEEVNKQENLNKRKRSLVDDICSDKLKAIRLENEDKEQRVDHEDDKEVNKLDDNCSFVATFNLPNFVIDGCAPHLQISPQKKPDKDWLTKFRIQKSIVSKYAKLLDGNEDNCDETTNNLTILNRTPTSKKKKKVRCSSPQSPLMRFFKVTSNNNVGSTSQKSNLENSDRREANV